MQKSESVASVASGPRFAKNGTALTEDERAAIAKRRGICARCLQRTHVVSVFKKVPITNDDVFKGICIKCQPASVPPEVLANRKVFCVHCSEKKHVSVMKIAPIYGDYRLCIKCDALHYNKSKPIAGASSQKSTGTTSYKSTGTVVSHKSNGATSSWSKSNDTTSSWSMCSRLSVQSTEWHKLSFVEENPSLWSISYYQLMDIASEFLYKFGPAFSNERQATMRDVNSLLIAPSCVEHGKSYALQKNPEGLLVDSFISHSWDEPFVDFVESIQKVFQTWAKKPNLWICAFALDQSHPHSIKDQVGTENEFLSNSPFVMALKDSKKFVVVRNAITDLYTRIWW